MANGLMWFLPCPLFLVQFSLISHRFPFFARGSAGGGHSPNWPKKTPNVRKDERENGAYATDRPMKKPRVLMIEQQQQQQYHLLDQYVAPGLRLWMLIGLVSSVLLVMIVIVCCFVRIRIPRTKRQIELRAAKRRKRRALRESGGGDGAESQEGEHNQYRGGQTFVLNSFNGANGGNGMRRSGNGVIGTEGAAPRPAIGSRSIPV